MRAIMCQPNQEEVQYALGSDVEIFLVAQRIQLINSNQGGEILTDADSKIDAQKDESITGIDLPDNQAKVCNLQRLSERSLLLNRCN